MIPGIATISVTVQDTKGGSDTDSLTIEIYEGDTNRPPVITTLNIDPSEVLLSDINTTAALYATVEDPDGLSDIRMVYCNLSEMNIGGEFEMFDNGEGIDENASDGTYSFLIEGLNLVDPGRYKINVTVVDQDGNSNSLGGIIQIIAGGGDNFTPGRSQSMDLVVWGVGAFLIITLIGVGLFMGITSGRRRRR